MLLLYLTTITILLKPWPVLPQVIPVRYSFPASEVQSVNGSHVEGKCQNTAEIAAQTMCRQPSTSVLFDDTIPTLTGLDSNAWADPLLTTTTATTSNSFVEFVFEFSSDFRQFGRVELILFNCPQWGVSAERIKLFAATSTSGVREKLHEMTPTLTSCDSLSRVCLPSSFTTLPIHILQFYPHAGSSWIHLAEVTFHLASSGSCPPDKIFPTPPPPETTTAATTTQLTTLLPDTTTPDTPATTPITTPDRPATMPITTPDTPATTPTTAPDTPATTPTTETTTNPPSDMTTPETTLTTATTTTTAATTTATETTTPPQDQTTPEITTAAAETTTPLPDLTTPETTVTASARDTTATPPLDTTSAIVSTTDSDTTTTVAPQDQTTITLTTSPTKITDNNHSATTTHALSPSSPGLNQGEVCPSCSSTTLLACIITAAVTTLLAAIVFVLVQIAVCWCHPKFASPVKSVDEETGSSIDKKEMN